MKVKSVSYRQRNFLRLDRISG